MLMRQRGMSDEPVLAEARQILSSLKGRVTRRDKAAENYFIGKCLLDNRQCGDWISRVSDQGRSIAL